MQQIQLPGGKFNVIHKILIESICMFNCNLLQQFSVINDEKFLQRVDKQFLHLEVWHRLAIDDDGNGNSNYNIQPLGVVNIPLHQFYIAYRDAAITNHLCKGKVCKQSDRHTGLCLYRSYHIFLASRNIYRCLGSHFKL